MAKSASLKKEVHELLDRLPETVTIDDVMYHLYVLKKIRKGLEAADRGDVISHEKVRKMILKK